MKKNLQKLKVPEFGGYDLEQIARKSSLDNLWKEACKMIDESYDILDTSFAHLDRLSKQYVWNRMKTRDGYIIKFPLGGILSDKISIEIDERMVFADVADSKNRISWSILAPKNAKLDTLTAKVKKNKLWLRVDRKMPFKKSLVKESTQKVS